jgi:cytochrome P450
LTSLLTPLILRKVPFNRVAEETFSLSDGTTIPKGATLGLPTLASTDPTFYPDPLTFDGYRFLNLSKEPGGATKNTFVSTSNEHIIFGHGKHACPGRFFASNEIKIILIHLLSNYELKFLEKDGKKGVRPKPMEMGADLVPNPETTILIRSKKGKYVDSRVEL